MCGRFVLDVPGTSLGTMLNAVIDPTLVGFCGTYNAAPGQMLPIMVWNGASPRVSLTGGSVRLERALWGIVASWSDRAKSLINARIETLLELRSFQAAAQERRCIIPMRGWYEWSRRSGQPKTPYLATASDGSLLQVAGVFDHVVNNDTGEVLPAFTVCTRQATGPAAEIHDRMPAIVDPTNVEEWLCGDPADAVAMAQAEPPPGIALREVSKRVGTVANDGPDLLEPDEEPQQSLF